MFCSLCRGRGEKSGGGGVGYLQRSVDGFSSLMKKKSHRRRGREKMKNAQLRKVKKVGAGSIAPA